jgi:hypothetical protein
LEKFRQIIAMNIFNNQKAKKHNIGNACGKRELLSISASDGFHALNKL